MIINGKKVKNLGLWETGNGGACAWLGALVDLEKGKNTIGISPEGYVLLDHLNVLKNKWLHINYSLKNEKKY